MSYQVLARKWRPGSFKEMVGQEHVLQALVNALDNDRLHHAYLFTGTRGVGKTTIARILAKCLNCEQGVTSTPCGKCSACCEIAEGRFVDLLEVDAASRTKVDDTRELLDNVQYAPTKGRYKVYLIDEVHMLSGHSFNALLKTLEEPPPHVKFLLATTEPQKLPVTVLSRCLQFNLKNLTAERIVKHLSHVLEQEQIPFEENGLWSLARAADGSMRDALSLTDQAIAHGNGKVTETEVAAMLGTINLSAIQAIAKAIACNDVKEVMFQVNNMAEFSPDYFTALGDLLSLLHRVAIYQALPDALDNSHGDLVTVTELGSQLSREAVQLLYQIGLLGRKDLPLAPDSRIGFEMVLLRMLAFQPQIRPVSEPVTTDAEKDIQSVKKPEKGIRATQPAAEHSATVSQTISHDGGQAEEKLAVEQIKAFSQATTRIIPSAVKSPKEISQPVKPKATNPEQYKKASAITDAAPVTLEALRKGNLETQWIELFNKLGIAGLLQNTAANLVLVEIRNSLLRFELDTDYSSLYDASHQQRLAEALGEYFDESISVEIEIGKVEGETPRAFRERIQQEKRAEAILLLNSDPNIQLLKKTFDAELLENTVKPIDQE